jgi:ATP-binding cassette subfamily B protein
MYDNVQTFSFSNIDKFSAASIVTRLTTDVTNVQNAYQMIIRMAIRGPVMMLFSVLVSFTISRSIFTGFPGCDPDPRGAAVSDHLRRKACVLNGYSRPMTN